jgi:transposase, IS605 orfB family
MSIKRYRYRAYPKKGQKQLIAALFGCVRMVFNDALAYSMEQYKDTGNKPSSKELSARLTHLKQTPGKAWLKNVSAVPLQQSLRDLDRAYTNFFASITGRRKGVRVGAPRFRRRSSRQAARFTSQVFKVRETSHRVGFVKLPKIGEIRFNLSRNLPSPPTSMTLIKEADGKYYVSFVVETTPTPAPKPKAYAVGVDMGLKDLAVTVNSNGGTTVFPNIRPLKQAEKKLARLQKQLSKKKKGSNRYAKQRLRVAKAHTKTRNVRAHYLHHVANQVINENQVITLETLTIKGLARTRLGKSVLDASWGHLTRLIAEKAAEHGRTLIRVDRFAPTTQTCSICGTPNGRKPLNIREWSCTECQHRVDRDRNAAANIMLAAGLAESLNEHCGDNVRRLLANAVIVDTVHPPRTTTPGCGGW